MITNTELSSTSQSSDCFTTITINNWRVVGRRVGWGRDQKKAITRLQLFTNSTCLNSQIAIYSKRKNTFNKLSKYPNRSTLRMNY